MKDKYILVDSGYPRVVEELPDFYPTTRLGVIAVASLPKRVAFDHENMYEESITNVPTVGRMQAFLAHICYNPWVRLGTTWRAKGRYTRDQLLKLVKKGLRTDDDVIQQWFEKKEVLKLLSEAKSYEEMLLAVRALGGDHEEDQDVRAYVEKLLGKEQEV